MGVGSKYCRRAYPIPKNIKKNIAVDIGANIGGFSNAYHDKFEKIIFFEANPTTFKIASNNTSSLKNVIGYNLAVSDKSGKTLKLMSHFSNDLGSVSCSPSVIDINKDWTERIGEVQTISLEDILEMINGERINFLKLDCENSEYEILMGKDLSKIDYIAMEIHCQMGENKYKNLLNHLSNFFKINGKLKYNKNENSLLYCHKL